MAKLSMKEKIQAKMKLEEEKKVNKYAILDYKGLEKYKFVGDTVRVGKTEMLRKRIDILQSITAEDGDTYYEMVYYTHQTRNGQYTTTVVCPKETFGKKCPVCEHIEKMKREGSLYDDYKGMRPKKRALYSIIDSAEPDKVYVLDTSYQTFGKKLLEDVETQGMEDEDIYDFSELKKGQTLNLSWELKTFDGNKYYDLSRVDFKARKIPLSIKELPNLYEMIIQKTPEEISDLFFAQAQEETLKLAPIKAIKKIEDDEEEEDIETESGDCPSGLTFGKDCDEDESCENCHIWAECYKAKQKSK